MGPSFVLAACLFFIYTRQSGSGRFGCSARLFDANRAAASSGHLGVIEESAVRHAKCRLSIHIKWGAAAIAKRQHATTVEDMPRFCGRRYSLLELLYGENKSRGWASSIEEGGGEEGSAGSCPVRYTVIVVVVATQEERGGGWPHLPTAM